jgi:hypothetical protein
MRVLSLPILLAVIIWLLYVVAKPKPSKDS